MGETIILLGNITVLGVDSKLLLKFPRLYDFVFGLQIYKCGLVKMLQQSIKLNTIRTEK